LRLIGLEVQGYRRLVDVKVNLAGKIIAIVGPNEAGKTSLLHALERLDKSDPVPRTDRPRAKNVGPETVYIKADFQLDGGDQETFSDLDLEEEPVRMSYGRRVDGGGPVIAFHPSPKRPRARFDRAMRALTKVDLDQDNAMGYGGTLLDDESDDRPTQRRATLGERLQEVLPVIANEDKMIDDATLAECDEIINELRQNGKRDLAGKLHSAVDWRQLPEIGQEIHERILGHIPRFLLFNDADRDLLSEYDIQDPVASNPPPALASVARLAELDLKELLVKIGQGARGPTKTMLNKANKQLAKKFERLWRQSNITLELDIQETVMRIFIKEGNVTVTEFDERSAGLRMFVALAAFVTTRSTSPPPILLIDEAEVHLHYDAQADLIDMLMTQEEAAQVIYTTHSPGCLPLDLGTGIRVIAPTGSDGAVSEVRNAFWTDHSAGFSPLLLAMGAGAAAFSTTRYAVIAEGPSEMILLPSLIRAATREDYLLYQVAPGLSETPTSQYPDLDLHAARVAFVVDGDPAGLALQERLAKSGVPKERIAVIKDGMTLEDTVDDSAYRDAVCKEADVINKKKIAPIPADKLHPPKASSVKEWYENASLKAPSKTAVANRLVQDGRAIPNREGARVLRELHKQVTEVFEIKPK
jgi:predicted ATP-dependent endonuclease of OLD family